jgi:ribosomal protein S27AE
MTKIIKFPEGEKIKDGIQVNREFCQRCGGGLDLWTGSDGVAYGICPYCDMGVGKLPIVLVQEDD